MNQQHNHHIMSSYGVSTENSGSNQQSTQSIADYLAQLLKDRKQLAAFPNVFLHMERLLDEEIAKVRASLFHINGVTKEPLQLPDPEGESITMNEKVYVPVKEYPDFNFVGRILGPRGMTAKQLEQETGCKIMVRGKGSMRDKKKEDANRGKPNWEHLSDDLHVLITVEDTENRASIKLKRALDEVKKLLVPHAEGEDELKKRQLMELAIINGTYRDSTTKVAPADNTFNFDPQQYTDERWKMAAAAAAADSRMLNQATLAANLAAANSLAGRTAPNPLGAPIILSPRISVPTTAASLIPGSGPPPTIDHTTGLIYASPYTDYSYALAAAGNPLLAEYPEHSVGAIKNPRRQYASRDHPY
ncbi:protein held out wings isoform X1 [Anopheles funestus]|uniref:protein held out wings isoform X1 n=1 Tax=Anopheles funestus TaxID=62324 RepID=UPI0020C5FBAB|nr:protein held out wings isoform X1 [Anopheles funestus]XP_049284831.1 protein held out wings isoform X1 [Anopheles funestus]XP_049284832.1 protein held out wings isoform X1 [Anopheles funestus]XP_049284833.1 protein held out wings isoform X1 [Anopheles funestus]